MSKVRRYDEGGDVERKELASGFSVDKDYPSGKEKPVRKKDTPKNYNDEKDAGPKEDTSAVTGRADPASKHMPSKEQKEENAKNLLKEAATTAVLGGLGKAVQTVGRVGEAFVPAGRTYAERKAFYKASEDAYNRTKRALAKGETPPAEPNIYGKKGFTGRDATDAVAKRFSEKGYAKGGSIRGGGCEVRGKTKGRFV